MIPGKEGLTPGQVEQKRRNLPPDKIDDLLGKPKVPKQRPPSTFQSPKAFTLNPLTNLTNYLTSIPTVPEKPEDRNKAVALFIPDKVNAKVAVAAANTGVQGEDFWHMVHTISASVPQGYNLLHGGVDPNTGESLWVSPWSKRMMDYNEACTFMKIHKEEVVGWLMSQTILSDLKPKVANNITDYFSPRVASEVMRTLAQSGHYASSNGLQTFSLAVATSTIMKPTDLMAFKTNYQIAQDPALGLDFKKPVDTMNALVIAANAAHDGVKMSDYNDLITYVAMSLVELDKKTGQPMLTFGTATLDYEKDKLTGEPDYTKPLSAATGSLGKSPLDDPDTRQFFGTLISYRAMMDSIEGKSLSPIEKWAWDNYGKVMVAQTLIGAGGGQLSRQSETSAYLQPDLQTGLWLRNDELFKNYDSQTILRQAVNLELIQRALDAGLTDDQIWDNGYTRQDLQGVSGKLPSEVLAVPVPDVYIERLNGEEGSKDVVSDILRAKVQAAQAYFYGEQNKTTTTYVSNLVKGVRGRSAQYKEQPVTTIQAPTGTAGIYGGGQGFDARTALLLGNMKLGKTVSPELWSASKLAMNRAIEYSKAVYKGTDLDKTAWGIAARDFHDNWAVSAVRSTAHWQVGGWGLSDVGGLLWAGLNVPIAWANQAGAAIGWTAASATRYWTGLDQDDIDAEFDKRMNDFDEIVSSERPLSSILIEDYHYNPMIALATEMGLYVITDPFLYGGTAWKLAKETSTFVEGGWRDSYAAITGFAKANRLSYKQSIDIMAKLRAGDEAALAMGYKGLEEIQLDTKLFDVLGIQGGKEIRSSINPLAAAGEGDPLHQLKSMERFLIRSRQYGLNTIDRIIEAKWLQDFRYTKTARNLMTYFTKPLETVWTQRVASFLETKFVAVGLPSAKAGKEVTLSEAMVEAARESLVDAGYIKKIGDGSYVLTDLGKDGFKATKLGRYPELSDEAVAKLPRSEKIKYLTQRALSLTPETEKIKEVVEARRFFNVVRRIGPRSQYERIFKSLKGPWRKVAIDPKIRNAVYDMVAAKYLTGASLTEKDMITVINEVLFRSMRGCPIITPTEGSVLKRYYDVMTNPELADLYGRGVFTLGAKDADVLAQWERLRAVPTAESGIVGDITDLTETIRPPAVDRVLDLARSIGLEDGEMVHYLSIYAKDALGVEKGSNFTSLTNAFGRLLSAAQYGRADIFIPKLRSLPMRKLVEEMVPWLEKNEGPMGKVTRGMQYARDSLGSVVPSMAAPFDSGLGDWTRNKLARSRVFSREEMAEYTARAEELSTTTSKTSRYLDREGAIYAFVKEMDEEMVRRIFASRGIIDPEAVAIIVKRLSEGVDNFNESFFGINARVLEAIRKGKTNDEIVRIMLEEDKVGKITRVSQTLKVKHVMTDADLWTRMMSLDPVFVRQLADESLGMTRGIILKLQKALGTLAKDETLGLLATKSAKLIDKSQDALRINFQNQDWGKLVNGQIWQRFTADCLSRLNMAFKYNAILSGRYAMRVPIMDEQMRIAADIGIVNRLISGRKIYQPMMERLFPGITESRLGGAVPVTIDALAEAQLDARVRELGIKFNSWEDFRRGVDEVLKGTATEDTMARVWSAPIELREVAVEMFKGSPVVPFSVKRSMQEQAFFRGEDTLAATFSPFESGDRRISYRADGSVSRDLDRLGPTFDSVPLHTISDKMDASDPLVNVAHEQGHAILEELVLTPDWDLAKAEEVKTRVAQYIVDVQANPQDATRLLGEVHRDLAQLGMVADNIIFDDFRLAVVGELEGPRGPILQMQMMRNQRGAIPGVRYIKEYDVVNNLPYSRGRVMAALNGVDSGSPGSILTEQVESYLHESFAEMFSLWKFDREAMARQYPSIYEFFEKYEQVIASLADDVAPGKGLWKYTYVDTTERVTKPSQLPYRQATGHVQTFLFSGDSGFMDEQKIGHALDTILDTMPPSEVHLVLDGKPGVRGKLVGTDFSAKVRKMAEERGITTITETPFTATTVKDKNVRYVFGFHKDSANPHFNAISNLRDNNTGYTWYQPGEPGPVDVWGNLPRRFDAPPTTMSGVKPTIYLPVPEPTQIAPIAEFNSGAQANFWRIPRSGDALKGLLRAGGEGHMDPTRMKWDLFKWGPTKEEQNNFFKGWYRMLAYQYGRGEIGPFILELRANPNMTIERAEMLLREKILNTPGLPERFHILGDDGKVIQSALTERVEAAVEYAWQAIPNKDIARIAWSDPGGMALERKLREYVDSVKRANTDQVTGKVADITDKLPQVNGMRAEITLMGKHNSTTELIDKVTNFLFEGITNKMNRGPYGNYWYNRTYRALTEQCAEWGMVPDKAGIQAIEIIAHDFAVKRVKDVLFDFQRQNRFMELMGFVTPFLQPYAEAMVVWKRMLLRNPGYAAYLFDAYRGLKAAGFARTDPITGQEEFSIPILSKLLHVALAPIGDATGLTGQLANGMGGIDFLLPFNSLNFIFNQTLDIPLGDFNFPLPVPGLSPPVMFAFQKISEKTGLFEHIPDSLKISYAKWLYQYGGMNVGDVVGSYIAPRWVLQFAQSMGIDLVSTDRTEDTLQGYRDKMLLLMDAEGVTVERLMDPTYAQSVAGFTFKQPSDAQAWRNEQADKAARRAIGYIAIMSNFFPGTIHPSYPTEFYQIEWDKMLEAHGSDYEGAFNEFVSKYPDMIGVTVSKYYASTPVPGTGTPTEWRAGNQINVPATDANFKFLTSPEFAELADTIDPRLLFSLLPSLDVASGELKYDTAVSAWEVAMGMTSMKTTSQYQADIDIKKAQELAYDASTFWRMQKDAFAQQGIGESDASYIAAKATYDKTIDYIKWMYPGYATYYDPQFFNTGVKDKMLLQELDRAVNENPAFAATPVGKVSGQYFDVIKKYEPIMRELGIASYNSKLAENYIMPGGLSLKETIETEFQTLRDASAGFDKLWQVALNGSLTNITSLEDEEIAKLTEEQKAIVLEFEAKVGPYDDQINQSNDPGVRSAAFFARSRAISEFYQKYGDVPWNPVKLWWDGLNYREKDSYTMGLAGRAPAYYNEFERTTILGLPTNPEAEATWNQINSLLTTQELFTSNVPGDISTVTDATKAEIDSLIQIEAAVNPVFAHQVYSLNTPGYKFFSGTGYATLPADQGGDSWRMIQQTCKQFSYLIQNYGIDGYSQSDVVKRNAYLGMAEALNQLIEQLKRTDPVFADQWLYLDDANGADLLTEVILPEPTYTIGGSAAWPYVQNGELQYRSSGGIG